MTTLNKPELKTKDGREGYSIIDKKDGKRKFVAIDKYESKEAAYKAACKHMGVEPKTSHKEEKAKVSHKEEKPQTSRRAVTVKRDKNTEGNTYLSWTVATGLSLESKNGIPSRWMAKVREEGEQMKKSFSVKALGEQESFIEAINYLLDKGKEVAFKVDESELPVSYKAILKKCEATKDSIYFV